MEELRREVTFESSIWLSELGEADQNFYQILILSRHLHL